MIQSVLYSPKSTEQLEDSEEEESDDETQSEESEGETPEALQALLRTKITTTCSGDQHVWSNTAIYVKDSSIHPIDQAKLYQLADAYSIAAMVDITSKRPQVSLHDHRGPAFSRTVLFKLRSKVETLISKTEENTVQNDRCCNCSEQVPKWGAWVSGHGFYD